MSQLQTEFSVTGTGIDNAEWAVVPPGISDAAKALDATHNTDFP